MSAVTVIGNLTRDPELRFGNSGTAICSFGIAENRKRGDEEHTSFFDCVAFGSLAENVSESLARGDRIVVHGRLEQRTWESQDGGSRSKVEVVADEVGPSLRWATADVVKSERS